MANVEFKVSVGASNTKLKTLTKSVRDLREELERAALAGMKLHQTLNAPLRGPAFGNSVGGLMGVYAPPGTRSSIRMMPQMMGIGPSRMAAPTAQATGQIPFVSGMMRAMPTVLGLSGLFTAVRGITEATRGLAESSRNFGESLRTQEQSAVNLLRNLSGVQNFGAARELRSISNQIRMPATMANQVAAAVFSATGGNVPLTQDLMRLGGPLVMAEGAEAAANILGAGGDISRIVGGELNPSQALGALFQTQALSRAVGINAVAQRFPRLLTAMGVRSQEAGASRLDALQQSMFLFQRGTVAGTDKEARIFSTNIINLLEQLQPGKSDLSYAPGVFGAAPFDQLRAIIASPELRSMAREDLTASGQFGPIMAQLFSDVENELQRAIKEFEPQTEDEFKAFMDKIMGQLEMQIGLGAETLAANMERNLQVLFENTARTLNTNMIVISEEMEQNLRDVQIQMGRLSGRPSVENTVSAWLRRTYASWFEGGFGEGTTNAEAARMIQERMPGLRGARRALQMFRAAGYDEWALSRDDLLFVRERLGAGFQDLSPQDVATQLAQIREMEKYAEQFLATQQREEFKQRIATDKKVVDMWLDRGLSSEQQRAQMRGLGYQGNLSERTDAEIAAMREAYAEGERRQLERIGQLIAQEDYPNAQSGKTAEERAAEALEAMESRGNSIRNPNGEAE